jgi:RNase H-fold protein (predicted Holliday junction resolvase)
MTIKPQNVLGIDWGSKYIWVAYAPIDGNIVFPVWYLLNDKMIYFNLWDIIQRHNIRKIVLWFPKTQKDTQEKITDFIKHLELMIDPNRVTIETIEEDYTSVQAWEIVSNFKKNVAEDTVSAMLILERWKNNNNW